MAPPLVDGNTLGSSMKWEKLNQESYPLRQEDVRGDTDGQELTICQSESSIISRIMDEDEATEDMVRVETPRSSMSGNTHASTI